MQALLESHLDFRIFDKLHPYHIIFDKSVLFLIFSSDPVASNSDPIRLDRSLLVVRCGPGISALCPAAGTPGVALSSFLVMAWPRVPLTLRNVERFQRIVFQFQVRAAGDATDGTVIKGISELFFIPFNTIVFPNC